ncbi:LacI family DNA-binding transcriptional regulator [Tunturibacter empetritectus]|uniref:LacI family transcriptional regulator n=1 Tax=Tunturiibacter lichenicola TaxID=2051959 RepID=A0A7W8N1B2_9BACT|nr:LacI family DNA-binding transcriptional regulator [Edaphobacter lichenicola]MBB5342062.1 LacI family transcriptional regulator [Edaphobacter lichenicola]
MKKSTKTRKRELAPGRMDIRDVARRANVSSATVSRTINQVSTVNPQLAKRVWQAIEDLNYFPNTQARALVSGRSRILGLIISEITNPFFPELIQQFEDVAVESNYEVLIGSTNYDPKRMFRCIRRMLERKVDGVAIMTFGIEAPLLDELAARQVPLVFIDTGPDSPFVRTLKVDYQTGIRQGVQHLAALGHRRIAFITGPLALHSAKARRDAFAKAMREIGVTVSPESIVEGAHTLEGGTEGMRILARNKHMPTAVMCSNDMTAIGVLHELYKTNTRVPDEISVIGFDDIRIAEFTFPPLTTIQMSCSDIARSAIEALRAGIEKPNDASAAREWTITTRLIVRQTTSYPRGTMLDNQQQSKPSRRRRSNS